MAKASPQSRSWSPDCNQLQNRVGTSIRCHQFDCPALLWLMSVKQTSFWVLLGSIVQAIWFMQDIVVSNLYKVQFERRITGRCRNRFPRSTFIELWSTPLEWHRKSDPGDFRKCLFNRCTSCREESDGTWPKLPRNLAAGPQIATSCEHVGTLIKCHQSDCPPSCRLYTCCIGTSLYH